MRKLLQRELMLMVLKDEWIRRNEVTIATASLVCQAVGWAFYVYMLCFRSQKKNCS